MMQHYLKFKRASKSCLLCDVDLEKIDRHPTTLNLGETESAIREDICPNCWSKMDERGYFGFWITRRFQEGPTTEERKLAKAERNEALWRLFNVLYSQKEAALAPQLFLTAHLLMKYRVIQFVEARENELIFLHGPSSEQFLIPDLPLDAVSFVDVKTSIDGQLLDHAPEPSEQDEDQVVDEDDDDS